MLAKPKKISQVYLDHAATTAVRPEVMREMAPYFSARFGNPSSLYNLGREAGQTLLACRKKFANLLHTQPGCLIFTGGGTESDNLAIFGVARAHAKSGRHIIASRIEHHAVIHPLEELQKEGFAITWLKVDKYGLVSPQEVAKAIRPDTILISVMFANNEVGSIQPLADIGREILKYRQANKTVYPYFHSDACQAAGYLELDVEKLHVDLLTLNGSKIYGPKGVGLLYLRAGVKIKPMIIGGGQERNLRSGTENIPAIVGFTKAFELAQADRAKEGERVRKLAEYLWTGLQKNIDKIKLNGPAIGAQRLANNLNITFQDIEGEALLLYLDEYGIMCSTGSACTSESLEPSHVLTAMGLPYEDAHGSLRFSLGRENTKADADYLIKYLPPIVKVLREMSPVNLGVKKHARYKR